MATGTDAGLLDGPQPQSVFKHGILDQHAIRYATMTASRLPNRRAVLFDGFAGRGRFDTGQAASAELMMLHAQKMKASTQIDIFRPLPVTTVTTVTDVTRRLGRQGPRAEGLQTVAVRPAGCPDLPR
jgi:hypothetical protein